MAQAILHSAVSYCPAKRGAQAPGELLVLESERRQCPADERAALRSGATSSPGLPLPGKILPVAAQRGF